MGQAKIRGTREQRVEQAKERERLRMQALMNREQPKAVRVAAEPEAVPVPVRRPIDLSQVERLALIAMLGAPMMNIRRGR